MSSDLAQPLAGPEGGPSCFEPCEMRFLFVSSPHTTCFDPPRRGVCRCSLRAQAGEYHDYLSRDLKRYYPRLVPLVTFKIIQVTTDGGSDLLGGAPLVSEPSSSPSPLVIPWPLSRRTGLGGTHPNHVLTPVVAVRQSGPTILPVFDTGSEPCIPLFHGRCPAHRKARRCAPESRLIVCGRWYVRADRRSCRCSSGGCRSGA
jgi:hypothetical protein